MDILLLFDLYELSAVVVAVAVNVAVADAVVVVVAVVAVVVAGSVVAVVACSVVVVIGAGHWQGGAGVVTQPQLVMGVVEP